MSHVPVHLHTLHGGQSTADIGEGPGTRPAAKFAPTSAEQQPYLCGDKQGGASACAQLYTYVLTAERKGRLPACLCLAPGARAGDTADRDANGGAGQPCRHAEAAPCQPEPAVCHAVTE